MFNTTPSWHRLRAHVRFIDSGTDAGGSGTGDSGTEDPDGQSGDIDWKAKFEEERAHSRKWEQRAKDNNKAADELKRFKDSQLSESERTAKRIKELEDRNAAYEAQRQQSEWKAQVSRETGVPAELLHGDSLEAMQANAKAIDRYAHPKPKGLPNQGRTPGGKASGVEERNWVRDMFSNL